jgi:hypothetical protein
MAHLGENNALYAIVTAQMASKGREKHGKILTSKLLGRG